MPVPFKNKKQGQNLIFLTDADPHALAEALVALANASGGLIILGVNERGQLADEIWEEEAEAAFQEAAGLCHPPIPGEWQLIETGEQPVIGIRVARSPDLHSLEDGRVLVRSGPENRPLGGDEVRQLATSKSAGDFEVTTVAGATIDDFDKEIVDEYLLKRATRGAPLLGARSELLFEIGATTRDGQPTVAGILLFGKNPQVFLPQSGLVFVRFPGSEPRGQDGSAGYGRRDELSGPLARVVERAWNIVWEEMRVGARVSSLEREELTEYPRFAVREALINAVAHRDYRIRGRRIELRMYGDRMEVHSPGGLPGYMTLDNLVEEHFSRNPRIVNGLFQWGYIEELGLGIDQMIEEMVQHGHPPPQFRATSYSFSVTLLKAGAFPAARGPRGRLNERQQEAMAHVREEGSMTEREFQRLFPGVASETLRVDLEELVEKDLLLKIGTTKGTHFILK